MKCKFCGSEDTRDFYISYAAGKKCIERFCAASCNDCNKVFFYMSECELPKIISSKYTIPKEETNKEIKQWKKKQIERHD